MDNSQFRRLLVNTPRNQGHDASNTPAVGPPKAVLGARKHSSIPMTPRQVGRASLQSDFARQLAERNAKANPSKKAKTSAPKGTKLAAGYIDRTKERTQEENTEIGQRIKNLEESMKRGEIDRETFEKLVQDITGGDVGTTHLVKGLDRKLLERVRRGEDVLGKKEGTQETSEETELADVPKVEDALDQLAADDVGTIVRDKIEKKGERIKTPPPVVGVKRSRNDILKELKRQREEAAKAAAAEHEKRYPTLGPGFRKVNSKGETSRIETDDRGREVLIITGPDGKEKRKIKKQKVTDEPAPEVRRDLDDISKPINMHNLPQPKPEASEDEDIFEGVGSNYNPLADLEGEDDDDDDDLDEDETGQTATVSHAGPEEQRADEKAPLSSPEGKQEQVSVATTATKRDYFSFTNRSSAPEGGASEVSLADATVRAALAKVRNLDENSNLLQNLASNGLSDADSTEARLKKRAAELAASDRDLEDMDLGFGASRFDDAEEMEREGEKVKLSQWKGLGADRDDDEEGGGTKDAKKPRKRGGKKRKGDKNNPDDVLKVMERQQEKKANPLG